MKFSKNVNNKKHAPKLIFSNEKKIEKDSDNFWHRKLTLKVRNWHFLIAWFRADVDLTKKFFLWKSAIFHSFDAKVEWKILKCYLLCKSYSLFIHFSLYILGMYILQASYQHPLWNFVQERNCFLLSHYTLAVCSTGKSLCKEWN